MTISIYNYINIQGLPNCSAIDRMRFLACEKQLLRKKGHPPPPPPSYPPSALMLPSPLWIGLVLWCSNAMPETGSQTYLMRSQKELTLIEFYDCAMQIASRLKKRTGSGLPVAKKMASDFMRKGHSSKDLHERWRIFFII